METYKKVSGGCCRGSITVEASLVVPVVIVCILALAYFSILIYQRAFLQELADDTARRAAAFWRNHAGSVSTGRLEKSSISAEGLYWRFFEEYKKEKIKRIADYINQQEDSSHPLKQGRLDSYSLLKSVSGGKDMRVMLELKDYAVYKKLRVTVEDSYAVPIGGLLKNFGMSGGYGIKVESEAVVGDPDEFIRNADFILDTESEIERKFPAFGDAADKLRETVKGMREKVEAFFK